MDIQKITPHMEVKAVDGEVIGTVDHLEGTDKIKLTKSDDAEGRHHFIPTEWVDRVEGAVHLSKSAADVRANWQE